jgi:TP901 family phage tail tape measure protein/lambda family phage tail tape measure protein
MAVSMETVLKLTAQVSGANNIQQVGNSLKNLSAVSQMSERTIDKLYIATKQYGQAAGGSVNSINQQINALTNLRNAVDPASNRYRVLTKDLQAFERQLQSLNATEQRQQAMRSAGGAAAGSLLMGGGIQGALGAGAGSMMMAGPVGMAAGAAVLASGALVGSGVGNAMDIAQQTRAISTLSDDASGLTARIQDLVREQGYLTDRATAGAAAYEILSSGFSSTDDVLKILRASSEGAAGGFSDIKTVADAATSILNGYGMSAEQVTRVVDQMILTQNDGKIKVGEYAQSIGRVVPTAVSAKVSLEEINGAVSALTAQGVPIETTFSGLNQAIKTILKPTKEASDLAAALGLQFNAQALATKGLSGFLEDVSRKTGKSTDALSILFSDIDGYKAVVALLNDDLVRFNRFTDNQAKSLNAAGVAARKAADPVKQFDNAWKDFSATLGDAVLPAISETLKALTSLIGFLNSGPVKGTLSNTGAALGSMAEGFLGPVATGIKGANAVRGMFPSVFGGAPAAPSAGTFYVPGVGTFDSKSQRLISPAKPAQLPATKTPPNVAAAIAGVRGDGGGAGGGGKTGKSGETQVTVVVGGYTGGGQQGPSRGRSSGPHLHAQRVSGAGVNEMVAAALEFPGGRTALDYGERRRPGYHDGYAGNDYGTPQGTSFKLRPGWSATDMGIKGTLGRGMRIRGPGGVFELGHLLDVATTKRAKGESADSLSSQMDWQQAQARAAEKANAERESIKSQARQQVTLRETYVVEEKILANKNLISASTDEEFKTQREMANFRLAHEKEVLTLKGKIVEVQQKAISENYSAAQKQIDLAKAQDELSQANAIFALELEGKISEQMRNQVKLIYEQADATALLGDEVRRYSELAFGGRLPDSTFTTGMDLMGRNQQDSRIGIGAMDGVNSWLDSVGTMRESFQSLATDGIGGLTDALTELTTTGTTNFREFTAQILRDTARIIIAQMVLRPLLGAIGRASGGSAFNIALPATGPAPQFAEGGISSGPRSGYGATLHGTEAIVPLSRGRSIPVHLMGGGGGGSAGASVTVNVDARGTSASGDNGRSEALGRDLSQVIDARLAHHRRPGGLLSA